MVILSVTYKGSHNRTVAPLEKIVTELLLLRGQKSWRQASIKSIYSCGMMITTLSLTNKFGRKNIVEIPTEYCQKINEFRLGFSQITGRSVANLTIVISPKGVYELTMY